MTAPNDERTARLLFNLIPDLGPVRFQNFLERFGSATEALRASSEDWARVDGMTVPQAEKFHRLCRQEVPRRLEEELALLERLRARVLISTDGDFPESLKSLNDAPIVLYMKGDRRPVDSLAVAVVGTRHPTDYGRAAAERLSRELAQAGVTIVSGLARGIDTAVHATVLKNKGRTIGVLGSGLDRFYPPENKPLMEKMAAQGAVLSEFSLTTPPDRGHFPRRNRLISGLALAVVVVEADETSGALITARLAGEQGRDVFAVPGSVFSKGSRGPHRLIRQGARLVEGAEDILDEIQVFRNLIRPVRPAPAADQALSGLEDRLLKHISLDPVGMDDLSVRSGLSPASLSSVLLGLELKGLVKSLPGKNYVRSESGLAVSSPASG